MELICQEMEFLYFFQFFIIFLNHVVIIMIEGKIIEEVC